MYDVAVIGGGPGGSTAGGVLARAGLKAVILERAKFPRFHIGESLLPRTRHLYDRLGLVEKIESIGFTRKYGAQFVSSDGKIERVFDFSGGTEDPYRTAYEVDRATFDHVLLDHARAQGCEVREETSVLDVTTSEIEPCRLRVRGGGRDETIEAGWVIDASGQQSFLAKAHNLRLDHPDHKKVAVFTRYRGMARRQGRLAGNIDIVFGHRCWFWVIPLRHDMTSIGAVCDAAEWKAAAMSPEDFLKAKIAKSPYVAERVGASERCEDMHVLANYSYWSRRFAGPGFTLVGDAAAFLDPIFSTGVLLAMRSGEAAANTLIERRRAGKPWRASAFGAYERRFRTWCRNHFRMINAYYSPGFADLFLNPSNKWGLVDAIIALLAGDSEMKLGGRFKLNLFYFLLWLNRRLKFAKDPRVGEAAVPHG